MKVLAKDQKEIRLVCIADAHLSAHNPPSYKVSYWDHCKGLLVQVQKFSQKMNVDAVVWAGDIFNLKTPPRNPLWFMSEVIEQFRAFKVPHWGILGNHDLKYGSLQGLKGQPAELLVSSGVFHLLDSEDVLVEADRFRVRVAGESFSHGSAQGLRDKKKEWPVGECLITVGHVWFGTTSGTFYGEPMFGPDFFKDSDSSIYVIGHHHDDQGVVSVDGKTYVVPGAFNRTGAHQNDLTRRLAASYVRVREGQVPEVNVLRLKELPIGEVLDLEVRAQVLKEEKEIEEFVQSLVTADLSGADPQVLLAEMEITQDVRDRAKDYLGKAEVK